MMATSIAALLTILAVAFTMVLTVSLLRINPKHFARITQGLGYTYDAERDAFIPPKPFASWVLNEESCLWDAPVAMPEDAGTGEPPKRYSWDEATTSWVEQGA
jgi:hypothetical protein